MSESDHPRDPEGKFTFAEMLAQTNREIEFHEKRSSFIGNDLTRAEERIAKAKTRGIPHRSWERKAGRMRGLVARHNGAISLPRVVASACSSGMAARR